MLEYPKPWSEDPVFQETYFCNVHREDDKVTRWIRSTYSSYVNDPMFEYNIVLARFINRPETLAKIGFQFLHEPARLLAQLEELAAEGKVWGSAYLITSHGIKMPKAAYLCNLVLSDVFDALPNLRHIHNMGMCGRASQVLQEIPGIGSFLAGQIVADLKNTKFHPLFSADDKATFVEPGPGSLRGLSWFHFGHSENGQPRHFTSLFDKTRLYVDDHWPTGVPKVDNQDLQNCLCEYDKYCRVVTAAGRSKRKYNGG